MPKNEWTGVWLGSFTSQHGHISANAVVIRPNGTGEVIHSALFHPEKASYWVTKSTFSFQNTQPDTLTATVLSSQTFAGSGYWGMRATKSGQFPIKSTPAGVAVGAFGLEKIMLQKTAININQNVAQMVTDDIKRVIADEGGFDQKNELTEAQKAMGLMLMGGATASAIKGDSAMTSSLLDQTYKATDGQWGAPQLIPPDGGRKSALGFGTQTTDITANYPEGFAYNVTTYGGQYASDRHDFITIYGVTTYATAQQNLNAGRAVYGGNKNDPRFRIEKVRVTPGSQIRTGMEPR